MAKNSLTFATKYKTVHYYTCEWSPIFETYASRVSSYVAVFIPFLFFFIYVLYCVFSQDSFNLIALWIMLIWTVVAVPLLIRGHNRKVLIIDVKGITLKRKFAAWSDIIQLNKFYIYGSGGSHYWILKVFKKDGSSIEMIFDDLQHSEIEIENHIKRFRDLYKKNLMVK